VERLRRRIRGWLVHGPLHLSDRQLSDQTPAWSRSWLPAGPPSSAGRCRPPRCCSSSSAADTAPGPTPVALSEFIPAPEPGHNLEDLIVVPELIAGLPAEERRAVLLYFFAGLRQQEIADRIGHSQMHVSRLLKRTLTTMRNELLSGPPGAA
jgi:RNA polymerase sigma factor (sigma-70 family)